MTPAERGNMDITKELARAVKYYMIMEDAFLNPGNFKEAHKNFVEKMEEYRKKENLTEEEAQYNIEMAVYNDWFESEKEAQEYVEQTRIA